MVLFVTCFAIAGSRVSLTGGLYAYVEVAFGRYVGFLAGVLEHMLAHESLLIAFADSAGINPAAVARARSALGGQGERDMP